MNKKKIVTSNRIIDNEYIEKIRMILGTDYHLNISYDEKFNIEYWALYRKYLDNNVYFSEDNKPIMTSNDYQLEDLYNYAKTHHKINIIKEFSYFCVISAIINLILCVLNGIFLKSSNLSCFILGFNICLIVSDIVLFSFDQKNFDIKMLELDELFLRDLKEIEEKNTKLEEEMAKKLEIHGNKNEEIKPQKKKAGRPKKNEKSTTN